MSSFFTLTILLASCALCECFDKRTSTRENTLKDFIHKKINLSFANEDNIEFCIDGKLKGRIGMHKLGLATSYRECEKYSMLPKIAPNAKTEKVVCLEDQETKEEIIISFEKTVKDIQCYNVFWADMTNITDCFLMHGAFWYGGGEVYHQHWPMSNISISETVFVTGDFLSGGFFGPVIENLWFTSKGVAIFVEYNTPLTVAINANGNDHLCFSTDKNVHPYSSIYTRNELNYTVCSGETIRDIYMYVSNRWIPKIKSNSNTELILEPIWSTWAKYKADINQSVVVKFAEEISSNGFTGSQVEIDDKWETCYGDLTFDIHKFPYPKQMVSRIRSMGMKVTLWIHPFVNKDCKDFKLHNDFFVKNRTDPENPLIVHWWNGDGGYVDFTNPLAREWFLGKLQFLKDFFEIHGFKWDAGEVMWLREDFLFYDSGIQNPSIVSKKYAELAHKMGGAQEVRVGFNSQSYPLLIRMLDKMSKWDYSGGLKTLIPTGLLFSLYGYSFILPDMIGGNNYHSDTLPEKELFIRWFQTSLFFPIFQFSIVPWDYDNETLTIIRNNLQTRDKFKALLEKTLGNNILNPLWMISPEDTDALTIDSEFLVGDSLLVAPVLEKNARARDVYLPKGKWEDVLRGGFKIGPIWLRKYTVLLHEIALFLKIES